MKKLLFAAFATFAILGCSNNDDLPCMTCDSSSSRQSSSSLQSNSREYNNRNIYNLDMD